MTHDLEVIEGEVVETIERLPAIRHAQEVTLFQSEDPVEIVEKATRVASALKGVLVSQKLTTKIGKGEHVRVEGWTLLGTMLGVFPVVVWSRKLEDGWEARVEARTRDGAIVGAAEAECLRSESKWTNADDYAVRSMAQTRATSKALRGPLGFVVSLAGYESTPAEEMTREMGDSGSSYHEPERRVEQAGKGIVLPGSWPKVEEAMEVYGETIWIAFGYFGARAKQVLHGDEKTTREQNADLRRVAAHATKFLRDSIDENEVPGPTRADLREAWAFGLAEVFPDDEFPELEGPPWRMDASEDDRPERETKS